MPYTGLAYLHAGEQIIPRERVGESNSTFAPVINVNANTNANPQEIGRIVSEELNRAWSYKFSKGVMR
jgi:hypothetical protein